MLGLGLGLQYGGVLFAYDSQAVAHFNRVIADGGTIPSGLAGCDAWFKAVKGVYGVSDITSAISSGIHPHYLGYKAGAGSGETLGSAAQTCYNAIGSTGDVVQTTAASQPLILPHTGTNYVWLPGVAGNYFSTPNNINNQLTDDFSFEAQIKPNVLLGAQVIICKDGGGAGVRQFQFRLNNALLQLVLDNGTQIGYSSTANVPFTANQTFWVRARRVNSSGLIQFFTSPDGVTWTQLGANVTGFTGALSNPNRIVEIGSTATVAGLFQGKIYFVNLYKDSTFTTPTQIFNPASYSRATSQTTWTSTTGEVWTLNTPSTNNALKAAIVDTTYLMGNGTSIGMRAASLNMNQTGVASYTAIRKFVNTSGTQVIAELSSNYIASSGFITYINGVSNLESIGIRANVGVYESNYTSTSTSLKLITGIRDITQTNEASPYLVNNVSQSFVSAAVANNTAAMNATGYNLLARNDAASLWSNVMMACDIVSKNADSTGTQTAMYSALKPFLVNSI